MPVMGELLPILSIVLAIAAMALHSKSVMLAAVSSFVLIGYISVQSGNTLLIGIYVLSSFFMVMSTGVFLTRTVMGDTA